MRHRLRSPRRRRTRRDVHQSRVLFSNSRRILRNSDTVGTAMRSCDDEDAREITTSPACIRSASSAPRRAPPPGAPPDRPGARHFPPHLRPLLLGEPPRRPRLDASAVRRTHRRLARCPLDLASGTYSDQSTSRLTSSSPSPCSRSRTASLDSSPRQNLLPLSFSAARASLISRWMAYLCTQPVHARDVHHHRAGRLGEFRVRLGTVHLVRLVFTETHPPAQRTRSRGARRLGICTR